MLYLTLRPVIVLLHVGRVGRHDVAVSRRQEAAERVAHKLRPDVEAEALARRQHSDEIRHLHVAAQLAGRAVPERETPASTVSR